MAIDDDFNTLLIIEQFLKPAGFSVIGFSDPDEALRRLPEIKPDCILLDKELSGQNGIIVCQKILMIPDMREVPIIFLSASRDGDMIVKALVAGARDYIAKPFHTRELITRIETHIEIAFQRKKIIEQNQLLQKRNLDNVVLNTRAVMMQEIIKQYTPQNTWEKADFSALEGMISIPDEEIEMVFMFMDIKSFTRFSEHRTAKEVIQALNSIFSPVTDIIYANHGDVDKYIGDSIFAVFAKPYDAVRSAHLSRLAIDRVNAQRKEENLPEMLVRTGIHIGKVVRGNVGGTYRKENALVGDAVNVASRLEHASMPGKILISDELYRRVQESVTVSKLHSLKARGKTEMIPVRFLESVVESETL